MPTLDISGDWAVFDNTQTVTLQNQDGIAITVENALQQGVDTILSDTGDGTLGYRTFCIWNLWRDKLIVTDQIVWQGSTTDYLLADTDSVILTGENGVVYQPQLNGSITDQNGTKWFISAVNHDVWGNKYQLECEAQAGTPVEDIDLP
jgi:hypothetical protein